MFDCLQALLQAEDRAHRIGQRNAINVVYLIAKGTVDEQIWKMISRKLDVVGVALNGTKDVMEVDSEQQSRSNDISGANSDHFIQQILQGLEDNLSRFLPRGKCKWTCALGSWLSQWQSRLFTERP